MRGNALLGSAILLAALAGQAAAKPGGSGLGLVSGSKQVMPSISGLDPVSGKRVSLERWAGKPVVINVWGSWCHPCNREAPDLARFDRAHPGVLLGLDVEDSKVGAKRFYAKYKLRYPSIFDPQSKLFRRLRGIGVPTTLFLDRRHRLIAAVLGRGTLAQFEEGFRRVKG